MLCNWVFSMHTILSKQLHVDWSYYGIVMCYYFREVFWVEFQIKYYSSRLGAIFILRRVFWAFFEPTYIRTFSLHKVRKSCLFFQKHFFFYFALWLKSQQPTIRGRIILDFLYFQNNFTLHIITLQPSEWLFLCMHNYMVPLWKFVKKR